MFENIIILKRNNCREFIYFCIIMIYTFSNDIYAQYKPDEIFNIVNKSVVVVLVQNNKDETIAQGSGVVINDEGVIVTNYHVFSGGKKILLRQGYNFINNCIIVGSDIAKDILLIKIIGENIFPTIKLGDSDNLKIGQRVYAIGTPLGEENSISEGIISGIRDKGINKYIQITASISPGSSGGAVVNEFGELIGISAMTNLEGQNINYAIPVNDILNVEIKEQDELTIKANEYLNKAYEADKESKFYIAINYYSKYLEIIPEQADIYLKRAKDYYNLKQLQNCLKDYSSYIEIKPNDCIGYTLRGSIYHQLGKNDLSFSDLNIAITLDYNTSANLTLCGSAYATRGDIYYEMGDYEKALADYESAYVKWLFGSSFLTEKIAKCKTILGK